MEDGWLDEWMGGCMDGGKNQGTDRWMGLRINECKCEKKKSCYLATILKVKFKIYFILSLPSKSNEIHTRRDTKSD